MDNALCGLIPEYSAVPCSRIRDTSHFKTLPSLRIKCIINSFEIVWSLTRHEPGQSDQYGQQNGQQRQRLHGGGG